MKIEDLTIEDFIIENKVIEQQIVFEKIVDLDLYTSVDNIMRDLDILRIIAHSNSQNRGDNGFPISKSKKHMCHRLISSMTNVSVYGKYGPANFVLVGEKLGKYLKEYNNMYDRLLDEIGRETMISDKLDPHEAFCCRLYTKEEIYKINKQFEDLRNSTKHYPEFDGIYFYGKFTAKCAQELYTPYFQFSGFTATLEE